MNRLKPVANLTRCDANIPTPELQLAVQQFATHRSSQPPLAIFHTERSARWIDALRAGADEQAICAQQHHDAQLTTIALLRARGKRSH